MTVGKVCHCFFPFSHRYAHFLGHTFAWLGIQKRSWTAFHLGQCSTIQLRWEILEEKKKERYRKKGEKAPQDTPCD